MQSFHRNLLFVAALGLTGAACGDGGTPPGNSDPVAAFEPDAACGTTSLTCTFTDASTDPDGAEDITSWSWTIEGAPDPFTTQNVTYDFPANGTYTVSLTVTDAAGATSTASEDIVVNVPDANNAPTASFTHLCEAETCTFTDGSTDSDGTIASWAWDFGDGETSTEQSPVHTYTGITELTPFTVTLTVTDDLGASNTFSAEVSVAPPAETVCDDGTGDFVPCTLDIEADAVVTITLTSRDCTAEGNTLEIINPIQATIFTDGCSEPVGQDYVLNGGTAFTAGTQLELQMISGSTDPDRIAPAIRVSGAYPDWVLSFDDGEDPTGPGEPDFNDIVLTVHAEPTP